MKHSAKVPLTKLRRARLDEAVTVLKILGFGPRQSNEVAGYTLLALLDLKPEEPWSQVQTPLQGITPIIAFIKKDYGIRYAPNTRETIRDEAVKHFVEMGLVVRNPDDPKRPTNSGKTVYQIETEAAQLLRRFNGTSWSEALQKYLLRRRSIREELHRKRKMVRVPVRLPNGKSIFLSPGGQNPLIKKIVREFCSLFAPDGVVIYIGDAETKFLYMESAYLSGLGVKIPGPSKMPDVVVHCVKRNWLLLIEAVTSAGPVDGKRRKELKELFEGSSAGLIFVTAFETRDSMRSFLPQISWETEVWVAEDPEHMIHFNGERFLGPYCDALPKPKA